MSKRDASRAFNSFLEKNEITRRQAALALGVTHPAIINWAKGRGAPESEAMREAIERYTAGAVPAAMWRDRREQKAFDALAAIEPFNASGTEG